MYGPKWKMRHFSILLFEKEKDLPQDKDNIMGFVSDENKGLMSELTHLAIDLFCTQYTSPILVLFIYISEETLVSDGTYSKC